MNSADKLLEIYERLKRLKQNGVKMKDIAQQSNGHQVSFRDCMPLSFLHLQNYMPEE